MEISEIVNLVREIGFVLIAIYVICRIVYVVSEHFLPDKD